jgi:tRNA (guanine37-N1)-methyltransferase
MRIDIITSLPGLLEGPFSESIIKRAREQGLVEILIHNLRQYGLGRHKQIDDYPYGGGSGMVMMVEPVMKCIDDLKKNRLYDEIIYLSPDGERLNQPMANELSLKNNLIFLCGHYKGIDERIRAHLVTREISIGDYVLTGGELAACVLADAIVRLIPGVMSDETSALSDSYQDHLIAPPEYTRPENYLGWKVPETLLSGDPKKIEEWRFRQSLDRTRERRPALYEEWSKKENNQD